MSPLRYLVTFAVLLGLAVLSFALSFADLGFAALPVALVIAATKAVLVALVFMHLVEQPTTNAVVALVAVALAVTLVSLTVTDVATR
jgi:cytochrome c oxidase subunit IV